MSKEEFICKFEHRAKRARVDGVFDRESGEASKSSRQNGVALDGDRF